MSGSTAIGLVSESLRNMLIGEMSPTENVTILAPDESGDERRINLFLYKAQENPSLKNMDWQVRSGAPTQLVPPPLSLNLFYLMTPYAPTDPQTGNSEAHQILGEAMRVLYENPIVPNAYLETGLQSAREQIKVMFNTLDLDELSRVWATFTQPFRLSVLYEVSVVQLDMLSASERVMAARTRQIGVPNVQAPFSPPLVQRIEPVSGPPGTVVTVHGEHLNGWNAYIRVMGQQLLNAQPITGDTVPLTIPNDLPQGFHEMRIDISHLFRRVFFFEVT